MNNVNSRITCASTSSVKIDEVIAALEDAKRREKDAKTEICRLDKWAERLNKEIEDAEREKNSALKNYELADKKKTDSKLNFEKVIEKFHLNCNCNARASKICWHKSVENVIKFEYNHEQKNGCISEFNNKIY